MLRMWILFNGVSRTQSTSGRRSLRVTSAARSIRCEAISTGDAGEGADAAGDNDHRVRGIRAAGDIGSNVGVRLQLNFCGRNADDLTYEVGAALDGEFFGQNAERAVGGDEVRRS